MGFEVLVDDSCLVDSLEEGECLQGEAGELGEGVLVMFVEVVGEELHFEV